MAAERPWATPEEVKAYTSQQDVKDRSDEQLAFDIARAELKVIAITNNHFDSDKYTEIPEPVKMAVILIAEAYAKNTVEATRTRMTSEKFDDYSYTAESSEIDLSDLDLDDLLAEYICAKGIGRVVMKLRAI